MGFIFLTLPHMFSQKFFLVGGRRPTCRSIMQRWKANISRNTSPLVWLNTMYDKLLTWRYTSK